jgi:hypothetical protein
MKTRIYLVGAVAIVLLGVAAPASANLAVNGFEAPEVTNLNGISVFAGGTMIVDTSTTWSVGLAGVDQVEDPNDFIVGAAHSGDQYLDLSNSPGPGSITTTFPTLALTPYLLTFWYSDNYARLPSPGDPPFPSASVSVTGSVPIAAIFDHSATPAVPGDLKWTMYSALFVSDASGSSTLKFETFPSTDTNYGGILLDTISATVVPEPAAWMFGSMVCGAFGFVYGRRALIARWWPAAKA